MTTEPQRTAIDAPGAPPAIGPYSHAVQAGGMLFCSGQVPIDPGTGTLVDGDTAAQARQCLTNLTAVCDAAGARLTDAARITIFLLDMADFAAVNEVYASFFTAPFPARATVAVAGLPAGARVEIDAVIPVA